MGSFLRVRGHRILSRAAPECDMVSEKSSMPGDCCLTSVGYSFSGHKLSVPLHPLPLLSYPGPLYFWKGDDSTVLVELSVS